MKHHYIPEFYLNKWCDRNGRLVEFSRQYKSLVKPRWTAPSGTGYELDLYALKGGEPSLTHVVERRFMGPTDNRAAEALRMLLNGDQRWTSETRSGWSRFILSLLLRNPEHIAWMRMEMEEAWREAVEQLHRDYPVIRQSADPPTFKEFMERTAPDAAEKAALILAQRVIDSPRLGTKLNSMRWVVLDMSAARHPLLTSDRPVIVTRGLVHRYSHLAVPISPSRLFVAVNNPEMEHHVTRVADRRGLGLEVNETVVSQAQKYAWGTDDRQLRFVRNRLSRRREHAPAFLHPNRRADPDRIFGAEI